MTRYATLLVIPLMALALLPDRPAKAGVGEWAASRYVCTYRGKKGFRYTGYGSTRAAALSAASSSCVSAKDTPCYFESCSSAR
jgi:hypothetical protein